MTNTFPDGCVIPITPQEDDLSNENLNVITIDRDARDVLLSNDPYADDWKSNTAFLRTMRSNMMASNAPKGTRLAEKIVEQWKKGHGRFMEQTENNCHDLVELNDVDATTHVKQILLWPRKDHTCFSGAITTGRDDSCNASVVSVSKIPDQGVILIGQNVCRRTPSHLPMLPENTDANPFPLAITLWNHCLTPTDGPAHHKQEQDTAATLLRFHETMPQDHPNIVADECHSTPVNSTLPSFQLAQSQHSRLGPNDVVTGHFHEIFHQFVQNHHRMLKDPLECSQLIVQTWRRKGGRFMDRDLDTGELVVDIGNDRARNRTLLTLLNVRSSCKRVAFSDLNEDYDTPCKRIKSSPLRANKMVCQLKSLLRPGAVADDTKSSVADRISTSCYHSPNGFPEPKNATPPIVNTILHEIGAPRAFHAEQTSIKSCVPTLQSASDKARFIFTLKAGRCVQTPVEIYVPVRRVSKSSEFVPASTIRATDVLYDNDNVRNHVGNVRYRQWLEGYCKNDESIAQDFELSFVARNYVWITRSFGGRFLVVDGEGWRDIGDQGAIGRTISMLKLLRFMPSLADLPPKNGNPRFLSKALITTDPVYSPLTKATHIDAYPSWSKESVSLKESSPALAASRDLAWARHTSVKPANLFVEVTTLATDIGGIHDVMLSGKVLANPRFNKHCDEVCYRHETRSEAALRCNNSKDSILAIANEWENLHPPGRFFVLHSDKWVQYSGQNEVVQQKLRSRISTMHIIKDDECQDNDVLIGKYDCYRRSHPGNIRFHEMITNAKENFLAANVKRRGVMAREIGKEITNKGGIFRRYFKTAWREHIPANKVAAFVLILLNREAGLFDDA